MFVLAAFLVLTSDSGLRAGDFPKRPNIVLVMTDDQGYAEMACHGNPILKTPHLDRLHRESVRFTDFHVSPTCSPTRASLMTGRHEFRSGVTHTISERERLSLKAVTFPSVLREAGYTTGIFGKWHLGDEPAYQPEKRGFDEVFIHGGGGIGQTYVGSCGDAPDNKYFDPAILHNGAFVKTKGYCTDLFFAQALSWIDAQRTREKPFLACITPNAPHAPYDCPEVYAQRYAGIGLSADEAAYYGMIANIDDNIGRLLDRLRAWDIERSTLLIFMTDNGHPFAKLYNAGMRGTKATPYQGGTRAPLFLRWPGTLPAGVDIDRLAAHIDLFPTLVELAGAEAAVEKLKAPARDGRTLVPLLRDPQSAWPDRRLFAHLGRWPKGMAAQSKHANCAVRSARFRLVNDRELYDILADPGETTNVIDQHPQEVAALRAAYDAWWNEVLPALENESAIGPEVNPFKERYWKQFGK
jgi:arylsulfatase A-like enzyme